MVSGGLLVLVLPCLVLAYPSPDEQLAAELEEEISAAGVDYTEGDGSDYGGDADVDTELMNILAGAGGGGGKPGNRAGGKGTPLPPGEMPNIPGLTKEADGQLYYNGEKVKSISALDSADEVKRMEPVVGMEEVIHADPLSSVQELKSIQEVLRKEPVLRMQEVTNIQPVSKIQEVVNKMPVSKIEEVSKITPLNSVQEISHIEEIINKEEVQEEIAKAFIRKHFPNGAPKNPFSGAGSKGSTRSLAPVDPYPVANLPAPPPPAPAAPSSRTPLGMVSHGSGGAAPSISGDATESLPPAPAPMPRQAPPRPVPSESLDDLTRGVELEDKKIEVLKKKLVKMIGEVRKIEEVISKHEVVKLEKVQRIREIKTIQEVKRLEEVRKIEEVKKLDEVLSMQEVLKKELVNSIQPVTKIEEITNIYPLTEEQVAELRQMMGKAKAY